MILTEFLKYLQTCNHVFIQTHDFPDPDAIASGYGFQHLLSKFGISASIIFAGEMQRNTLRKMITAIDIEVQQYQDNIINDQDPIVIVDGCKGNQNVTDLVGEEVAVIDHHLVQKPDDVMFADIRPEVGACSSIIWSYFKVLEIDVPRPVATALLIGINMDTALMTRGVGELDLKAFADLYMKADMQIVNSIIRNNIKFEDLAYYKFAIENIKLYRRFAFCYFPQGCDQNLLGILGDFVLTLDEIDFVALCALNGNALNLSIRSEKKNWDASLVMKDVLKGIGLGGGHMEMAGGVVRNFISSNIPMIYQRFVKALGLKNE